MSKHHPLVVEGICRRLIEVKGRQSCASLAELTGSSSETVRRYVNGESTPSIRFLVRLAEETNTSISWLLTGRGMRNARDEQQGVIGALPTEELVDVLAARLTQWPDSETVLTQLRELINLQEITEERPAKGEQEMHPHKAEQNLGASSSGRNEINASKQ